MTTKIGSIIVSESGSHGIIIDGNSNIEIGYLQSDDNGGNGLVLGKNVNVTIGTVSVNRNKGVGIRIDENHLFTEQREVFDYFGINSTEVDAETLIKTLSVIKESLENSIKPEIIATLPEVKKSFFQSALDYSTIMSNVITITPKLGELINFLKGL